MSILKQHKQINYKLNSRRFQKRGRWNFFNASLEAYLSSSISSYVREIIKLFTARESLVSDLPAGDEKNHNLFYSVSFADL